MRERERERESERERERERVRESSFDNRCWGSGESKSCFTLSRLTGENVRTIVIRIGNISRAWPSCVHVRDGSDVIS